MWKNLNFQFPPNLLLWLEVFTKIFSVVIWNFKTKSCQSWPWLGLSKNWPHIHYWVTKTKQMKIQMFPHQNYEPLKDNCNLHSLRDLYREPKPTSNFADQFWYQYSFFQAQLFKVTLLDLNQNSGFGRTLNLSYGRVQLNLWYKGLRVLFCTTSFSNKFSFFKWCMVPFRK